MLNDIVKGVAKQLGAVFGEGYRVYQNDVKQGLQEPCFFIAVLNPSLEPLLGSRRMKRVPLDVHYFPEDPGNNADLAETGDSLLEALEYITLPDGNLLRGTDMSYQVVDGVLHFFVSYNHTLNRAGPGEDDSMDQAAFHTDIQRG